MRGTLGPRFAAGITRPTNGPLFTSGRQLIEDAVIADASRKKSTAWPTASRSLDGRLCSGPTVTSRFATSRRA